MNKLPFSILFPIVFLFIFAFSLPAFAKDEEKVLRMKRDQCGQGNFTFQIAALKDNVPFSWITKRRDKDGEIRNQLHGLDFEFVMKLIEGTSIKRIRIIAVDSQEELHSLVLAEKADIAVGTAYVNNKSLSKGFLYPSYMGNPIVAVFAKGKGRVITDINQLRDMKIVSLKRDNVDELFKYTLPTGSSLSTVPDTKTLFQDLLSGKADVALIGLYTATADSNKYKIKEDLYFSQTPLRYPRFFLLMTQSRNCSVYLDEFKEKAKALSQDQAFLGEMLAKVYKELAEANQDEPKLEIPLYVPPKEAEPEAEPKDNQVTNPEK